MLCRSAVIVPAGSGEVTGNPSRVLGDMVHSERTHRWASDEPALLAPTLSGSPRQSKSGCVTPKTLRLVRPFACPQSIEKHRVSYFFNRNTSKVFSFLVFFTLGLDIKSLPP